MYANLSGAKDRDGPTHYPPTPVVIALRKQRTRQQTRRLSAGAMWHDHDLVFCMADGGPINPGKLLRNVRAIITRAGVPLLTIHALRHTHATLLLQDGQNAKVIQERLGHASITLTLNTYTNVVPAMQDAAVDAIGAVLFGEGDSTREVAP